MYKTLPLKRRLIDLMRNEWILPNDIDVSSLVDEMLKALASIDSDLRDRLTATGFYKLVHSEKISDEKCQFLLAELISERHMLCGLGNEEDDTVFNRSFSAIVANDLISYDKILDRRIFTDDEIKSVLSVVLKCIKEEKDLRAFDDIKGWAHAIAHFGDILATLAEDSAIGHYELTEILYAIKDKICIDYYCYISDEDIRLADAVSKIIQREIITEKEFSVWIASFLNYKETGDLIRDGRLRFNRSNFLWCISTRTVSSFPKLYPYVLNTILKLMEF